MKQHTKIYLKAFGYSGEDFIPCEIDECRAVDIHHIESRGMGGSIDKDRIENLMALSRENHLAFGDNPKYMADLFTIHKLQMERKGVKFDTEYINQKIKHYESIHSISNHLSFLLQ